MASIAIMLGGAVLNATAFIGGNYIAKALSGSSSADLQLERERHDKAMEKYQKDYAEYQEKRLAYIDFMNSRKSDANQASENISNMDEALKLYNQMGNPPKFSDYYRPNGDQRMGEMVYVSGGMLALGYIASKWV